MRILALTQRVPHQPDRGDRIRSHHLLKRLGARHELWLGCLSDERIPRDARKILDTFCQRNEVVRIGSARRLLQSAEALLTRQPLSLAWYQHPRLMETLRSWQKEVRFDAAYVFCSSMAPYWLDLARRESLPAVMDFIDVDSLKWSQYAAASSGPKAWIYRRERNLLGEWEAEVARA
ncbi:MAG TPA: sugar transferase, partial [Candidatus Krumholzibacteria bacterium]|nr:sugar transferase [Candidatus Krumholzibacteria bacterium]